ncbi:mitochondrial distribution and morphology [Stygiomarasmius scandens]|uniref:Mitochondrial distribution and morphology n=1 Tax=Marasmiellus scandens TaxID=2682957 RepID=A0ABR1JY06_9AGAR
MSSALERQIRPIYDALDTGSNKSAIVACNKMLKKNPKNNLVKALKALALVRSQKVEESLVLCDEVLLSKPTDDSTLNAMLHVLRGLGRHKDMVTMFEEAYKQQPANEELGVQAFFANVRAGHWKSAQQIATKMHKQFQEDRYLYWNVISAVLQANDPTTPPNMRQILYKLAHRLLSSASSSPLGNTDRFYLHLTILKELSLLDDAAALLDTEVGQMICTANLSCNELRRDIMHLRGLSKEEGERAERLILEKGDRNWLEFVSLLDGTFSCLQTSSEDAKEQCSKQIAYTLEVLDKVIENDGDKDRSGPLALIELETRARKHDLSTDPDRLINLMRQYFETFGDKSCCFEDLKPYTFLEGDEQRSWTSFLEDVDSDASTVGNLQRVINSYKLLRHTLQPSDITVESEEALAVQYTQQYLKALPLGAALPTTELQPADDLAILAGTTIINMWKMTGDQQYLYRAIILLEYALSNSKQSFQMRLILVRLYRLLGAPSLALEHYRLMRIKQVQNDTLSHFLFSRTSAFSLGSTGDLTLSTECIEASQVYLTNSQETSDFVIRAFTAEKYSQIPEFITFEDRLDNSLQRDMTKMEHLRMRIAHEVISNDIIDMELIELKFIFDRQHHDNRDFDILPNYQPHAIDSLNKLTLLFDKADGKSWLWTFLKLYIRTFMMASDLDDTIEEKLLVGDRPKMSLDPERQRPLKERLVDRSDEELVELTPDERALVQFADALAEWLEPFHDYARPPPDVVLAEAAKLTQQKTGLPLKGVEIPPQNGNSNGHKKDEEAPAITEPPEIVLKFFDAMKMRFNEVKDSGNYSQILHTATIIQEALLLLVTVSLRFKSTSVVKVHKLGNLVNKLKPIRSDATSVLQEVSSELATIGASQTSAENRAAIASVELGCSEIDKEFTTQIAKKLTESRKTVLEGIGKGAARLCGTYAQ